MNRTKQNMIHMERIDKSYPIGKTSLHVLKKVNFSVEKQDFIAILGTSGSGKSTLMNIIGCMDNADSGNYFLEGIPINTCSDNKLSEIRNHKIGFVFQKYHLIPHYTVLQNVILPLLIQGKARKEAIKTAERYIDLVGLKARITHKPHELSGGQQQRAAIARALVNEPSILLADEPTGALDSATGKDILSLFEQLNKEGHTIIVITHNEKVAHYSNKIFYLHDGVLQENR